MGKHTPAPWTVDLGFSDWGMPRMIEIKSGNKQIAMVASFTPYCIGESTRKRAKAAEDNANANLIAAAPAIYEALKRIVRDWDGEPEDMQEAQEALAQADGKS